jgi:RNA polymerase sigma factor (sigma-70 family)
MDNPPKSGMECWSQEDLLRAAHRGDAEAFTVFCVRVLPGLRRYLEFQCRELGVPTDLADDFAQDTFVRALGHIQRQESSESSPRTRVSTAWLQRIGYNLIVDWARANQRHQKAQSALQQAKPSSLTQQERDEREELLKFVGWLPDNEKEMLELVLLKGLHPLEAGETMGLGNAAAYKTYERAVKHVRDLIQEHGTFSESLTSR